ncbi:MAG: hypothetical protein AB1457_13780 [Chloroflexota bacterium]
MANPPGGGGMTAACPGKAQAARCCAVRGGLDAAGLDLPADRQPGRIGCGGRRRAPCDG